MQEVNKWEYACIEFLTGCSCADHDNQEECPECLKAFCDRLREIGKECGLKTINQHCIGELKEKKS